MPGLASKTYRVVPSLPGIVPAVILCRFSILAQLTAITAVLISLDSTRPATLISSDGEDCVYKLLLLGIAPVSSASFSHPDNGEPTGDVGPVMPIIISFSPQAYLSAATAKAFALTGSSCMIANRSVELNQNASTNLERSVCTKSAATLVQVLLTASNTGLAIYLSPKNVAPKPIFPAV